MDDSADEGCESDIQSVQRNIEELGLRIAPRVMDKGDMSSGTDQSTSPKSDTSDTYCDMISGPGGRKSPGMTSSRSQRTARSPRRRLDDEQYVYAVSQTSTGRLAARRRSDPGRISISPLRCRVRVDTDIAEDEDYDDDDDKVKYLGNLLSSTDCEDGLAALRQGWRPRSKSPHLMGGRVKTLRSQSLPGEDPALTEIGEAIGAIAVHKAEKRYQDLSPEEALRGGFPCGGAPRRRRSLSVECTSPLEAIVEDTVEAEKQKNTASRRFSTSAIHYR
ncbi:hypothetical protein CAPTEDRAFT_222762 [Capitella teleta]|uniref:Uncharacterized protein n=1 Tax=Capitella teleta TaxID=283909 RepID=R7U4F8_CAPTE|nr:hypothetical protein CAPTEDRAFT_222762 [Capitella teleta]|eukprot:ELT98055.1 hypothetical protein CAPTEDRAFT_222762 [Capitella teleta]